MRARALTLRRLRAASVKAGHVYASQTHRCSARNGIILCGLKGFQSLLLDGRQLRVGCERIGQHAETAAPAFNQSGQPRCHTRHAGIERRRLCECEGIQGGQGGRQLSYLARSARDIKPRKIACSGEQSLSCRTYIGSGAATMPLSSTESLRDGQHRAEQQACWGPLRWQC